jgi:hypothetical protein
MQQVGMWDLTDDKWSELVDELRGSTVKGVTMPQEHLQKYSAKYFIQNLLKAGETGATVDMDDVWLRSIQDGIRYIALNPWVFAKPEDDTPPKLNADGTVAPKKGDKKIIAKEVYEKNKDKVKTRKEWIALLVKEVGLTEAGASTYYANLKSGKY